MFKRFLHWVRQLFVSNHTVLSKVPVKLVQGAHCVLKNDKYDNKDAMARRWRF